MRKTGKIANWSRTVQGGRRSTASPPSESYTEVESVESVEKKHL